MLNLMSDPCVQPATSITVSPYKIALLQGGLINTEESDDLLIVLEPEAASLYCRGLDMKHFENESAGDELSMPEGTIYMLIDAGGM